MTLWLGVCALGALMLLLGGKWLCSGPPAARLELHNRQILLDGVPIAKFGLVSQGPSDKIALPNGQIGHLQVEYNIRLWGRNGPLCCSGMQPLQSFLPLDERLDAVASLLSPLSALDWETAASLQFSLFEALKTERLARAEADAYSTLFGGDPQTHSLFLRAQREVQEVLAIIKAGYEIVRERSLRACPDLDLNDLQAKLETIRASAEITEEKVGGCRCIHGVATRGKSDSGDDR